MKNFKIFCRFVILLAISFASILHVQAATFLADSHIDQDIHQVRTPNKEGRKSVGVQADDDLIIESLQVEDYNGNLRTPEKNRIIEVNKNRFTMRGVIYGPFFELARADNTKTHELCVEGLESTFVSLLPVSHCFSCSQADYKEESTDTPGIYKYTLNKIDNVSSYPNVHVKVTRCHAKFFMADNTTRNKDYEDVPFDIQLSS